MSVAILLRTAATRSLFQDVMVSALLRCPRHEVLLCSGFFQESFRGSNFQISAEANLAKLLASMSSVTTVGVHNPTWRTAYADFCVSLVAAGVPLTAHYKNAIRWHAKVFVVRGEDKVPVLGIIGSSNMTRNAFAVTAPFNHECDVVLWRKSGIGATVMRDATANVAPNEVVRASYDQGDNGGLTPEARLTALWDQVMKNAGRRFDYEAFRTP